MNVNEILLFILQLFMKMLIKNRKSKKINEIKFHKVHSMIKEDEEKNIVCVLSLWWGVFVFSFQQRKQKVKTTTATASFGHN